MKRRVAAAMAGLILASGAVPAAVAATKHPAAAVKTAKIASGKSALTADAPGDAYFGRLKMSALSVRYHIQRLRAANYLSSTPIASQLHDAQFVAESFYDWAQRYPKDAWLAQTGYALAQAYASINDPQAHADAIHAYQFVGAHFKDKYGHLSRIALANGVPQATVAATPGPSASPDVASATPAASSAPVATPVTPVSASTGSPTALASPSDAASPSATPTPSPEPKKKHFLGF